MCHVTGIRCIITEWHNGYNAGRLISRCVHVKSPWHERSHQHHRQLATDVVNTVRQWLSLPDQSQASELESRPFRRRFARPSGTSRPTLR